MKCYGFILIFIITFFGVWYESSKHTNPIQQMVISEKVVDSEDAFLHITPFFGLMPGYKSCKYVLKSKNGKIIVQQKTFDRVKVGQTIYVKFGSVYKTYEDAVYSKNKL